MTDSLLQNLEVFVYDLVVGLIWLIIVVPSYFAGWVVGKIFSASKLGFIDGRNDPVLKPYGEPPYAAR